jgi:hypothetical protein
VLLDELALTDASWADDEALAGAVVMLEVLAALDTELDDCEAAACSVALRSLMPLAHIWAFILALSRRRAFCNGLEDAICANVASCSKSSGDLASLPSLAATAVALACWMTVGGVMAVAAALVF